LSYVATGTLSSGARSRRADEAGRLIADVLEAAGEIRRLGDQIASAVDQTNARWQVLSVFSEGDWTVSRAARRLGVTRQSVQRVVDLLLEEGLLVAEANPDHARSPLIRLTPPGERTLATITAASDPWQARLGDRLTLDQLGAAREVLAVLTAAARAGPGPPTARGG
jgi:DNA-binding MarR family transcriptional regulator